MLKSHPLACLCLGLTLVFATVTLAVRAQQSAPTADQVELAVQLLDEGQTREAQVLFAAVAPTDPAYGLAQAYDALCRYELCRTAGTNDYRWFFDILASPALQQATLPREVRENLAFTEIDALYQSGEFQDEQALLKIAAFSAAYPASSRAAAIREYELAAWVERGMQRIYKAGLAEPKDFRERWTNGLAHLEQFVSRLNNFPANDYSVLPDRSLGEDLQVALAVLGGEPAALAQIPIRDAAHRERYSLMRVALHQKLHPEAMDQNLQLLADFQAELKTFPASARRLRVEYDLARYAFRAGERLWEENAGALPNEAQIVAAKRTGASHYFNVVRELEGRATVDERAGVDREERGWLRQVWYASYHYEQDYAGMKAAAETELAHTTPGQLDWLRAKVFSGIALYRGSPTQRDAAIAAFEEVMRYGFQNEHEHDVMILDAVDWRMQLAVMAADHAKVRELFAWVNQSDCWTRGKKKFLEDRREYAALAGWK